MNDDGVLGRKRRGRSAETWYGTTRMVWSLDGSDLRRIWQDVTPATGLTLRQAMLHYDHEKRAERFCDLEAQGYAGDPHMLYGNDGWPTDSKILSDFRVNSLQLREDQARLEFSLLQKLITGRLVATGYAASDPVDEPARVIVADRWRTLTPDFGTSQATAPGVVITGILVFQKRRRQDRTEAPRRVALGKVRKWYREWVEANLAEGRLPSREQDLEAAREALGTAVPRDFVRELRRGVAPLEWQRSGRRRGPT